MLAVVIIARDEEAYIEACLSSVSGLTDELIVLLDDRTTDRTAERAQSHGARVVCEPWRGFPAQRNRGLELASTPWVLFLDADELVTPALANELRATLQNEPTAAGFRLPRYNRFFGQILQGGGWYPDHQLRLLRRNAAHFDESRLVHEAASLDGAIASTHEHLWHENITRLAELWHKQSRYALAEAQTLYRQGRIMRWRNLLGAPAREFWRRYGQLGGWRDGPVGFLLCATMAWHELVTFLLLWSLHNACGIKKKEDHVC
ncbi:glycosyltransferase family 2 protein [Candidatus Chloroploca asiatica]|uniref:Glycosyl transferase n=1 Tax=Candidatus Chloroploca asiatica TaxID=1506545 RepID=A0A2H3KFG3_9CHLR|nr:glycosyltransferase family 2 protein [Candidatus Chloroploca asiatica]PDV96409.1 glycosyl transferase [Candidatus Chloroploca asiatica]